MKKGDAIAKVAQPIARTLDYFLGTNIQNCAGCKQMQNNLNAGMTFPDAIYNRLLKKTTNEETKMQFIITKQIVIEAATPEEAFNKISEGVTVSLSIAPRPQQPTQQRAPFTPIKPQG